MTQKHEELVETLKSMGMAAEEMFRQQASIDTPFQVVTLALLIILILAFFGAGFVFFLLTREDEDFIPGIFICPAIGLLLIAPFIWEVRDYITMQENPVYYYLEELSKND